MRYFWLACLSLCFTYGRTQDTVTNKYQKLISAAVFHRAFIDLKPLSITDYQSVVKRAIPYITVDTSVDPGFTDADWKVFQPLLEHITVMDTSAWRDNEIRDCALVCNGGPVDLHYALSKFHPADTTDRNYYSGLISRFNKPNGYRKWLTAFSRPVFDQTSTYAVLVNKAGEDDFGCLLYKWNGTKWVETVNISTRN
jgi:hypothetical protein